MCDSSPLRVERWRPLLVAMVLLLLNAAMAPARASADADPNYRIDPCDAPVKLSFHGLPPEPPTESEITSCGTLADVALFDASDFVGDQAAHDAQLASAARVTLNSEDASLKLRLVLKDGARTREYVAGPLTADGQRVVLRRVGHEGGPELAVSAERVTKQLVSLHVVDASVQRLARDIARLKQIRIEHVERIDPKATATFMFTAIPVRSLLALIGDVANESVTPKGEGYVIGGVKDFQALKGLWEQAWELRSAGDRVKLRATLEKIVELAQPNDADDVAVNVAVEAGELAELAALDQDHARAVQWRRRQLAELERESDRDGLDYARAQVELGRMRLLDDGVAEARKLLESAWLRFDRSPTPALEEEDRIVVYLRLLPALAAARAIEGDYAGAIALSERIVADRIAWLGAGDLWSHQARGELMLLQRLAHEDQAARATLEQVLQTPPRQGTTKKVPDSVYLELEPNLRLWLAPILASRWETLRDAPSADPEQWASAREAAAEVLAAQGLSLPAALEYEAALAHRLKAQGREHRAIQRAAQRAIELFESESAHRDGADRIRQLLESPPQ